MELLMSPVLYPERDALFGVRTHDGRAYDFLDLGAVQDEATLARNRAEQFCKRRLLLSHEPCSRILGVSAAVQ
jgi:hypothetical protein